MKPEKVSFHGIIPPVVTLFNNDGDFNWEANEQLTDFLITKGVHGILYMGSTGEFSSLTIEQRKRFVEKMVAYVNHRVPVLIGTGTTSLTDTIDLSKHAQESGADGVLVVSPYYWKFNEVQLFDYYTAIAKSIDISVMIYNIPMLTGQSLSPKLVAKLAQNCENIIGIKDTIESLGHIRQLISETKEKREDFAVFAAFDDLLYPSLQIGAAGAINGTAVFAPEFSVQLYSSFTTGDFKGALSLHQKISSLMSIYEFSEPLYLAIKEIVNKSILGYKTANLPPTGTLDHELNIKLEEYIRKHGDGFPVSII
ncbi:dihydrodipicolinate synthase family protein [Neobacillus mesonae]|uniref:dihydrodipicolinate synthase family protein n=1 Tax=Neobacillus mesonae TaxID=1193713 RepID=UPI0025737E5E|nr:dihydrodipicolinate synthase family protein [Neobacillus mesonae]MED4206520.1 dihydrodipicolinate synthase family protein [Neobacillus mesonae]